MGTNGFDRLQGILTPEELRRMDECEELRVISEMLTTVAHVQTAGEQIEWAERAKRNRESVLRTPRVSPGRPSV